MDWQRMRRSDNVADQRGRSSFGGRGGPMRLGLGGLLVVVIASALFGVNPLYLLGLLQEESGAPPQISTPSPPEERHTDFVRAILGDTEDTWRGIFQQAGWRYKDPQLVLFTGTVQSACGFASAAAGPFYCARDAEIYLDVSFFQELSHRFGAPGDFARAYVIAHEVGHHIQKLLGILDTIQAQRAGADSGTQNTLSVRQELQADCLAGVWGHSTAKRGLIDQADIEAGLQAAAQIGDDRMQRRLQGTVVPEAFTHGSSEQRARWFRRGLHSGDPAQCNTFATGQL
jgi:predicted metalloprotease